MRSVRLFIASPGDVKPERDHVRNAIADLNRTLANTLDTTVHVDGWEQTPPGMGRPQAIINSDLDRADLVLGILAERWGSPTGEYSSGFEEEMERALERHRTTGKPEVWMTFRTGAAPKGADAEHIEAFRQRLIDQREMLFTEYRDAGDLALRVVQWVFEWVFHSQDEEMIPPTANEWKLHLQRSASESAESGPGVSGDIARRAREANGPSRRLQRESEEFAKLQRAVTARLERLERWYAAMGPPQGTRVDQGNLMGLGSQTALANPYLRPEHSRESTSGVMGVFGGGLARSGILLRVAEGEVLSMIAVHEFAPPGPEPRLEVLWESTREVPLANRTAVVQAIEELAGGLEGSFERVVERVSRNLDEVLSARQG